MGLYKRLVVPDVHHPNADKKAWSILIDFARDFKPQEIVLLGDFQDCYNVSSFGKDPIRQVKLLSEELEQGKEALLDLELTAKNKSLVYLEGNHEFRISRYKNEHAALLGDQVDTRDVLMLPRHAKYLPYGQDGHYQMGNWLATHGTIYNENVAASMLKRYGCNVIFGHVHRRQVYSMKQFSGETITAMTPGWLGNEKLAMDYEKGSPNTQHGFAYGIFKRSGRGSMILVSIDKGEAFIGDRLYE